jgi:hypothetical protein
MGAKAHRILDPHKLAHEVKAYAGISLYIYICFVAILFYKAAVLEAHSVGYAPYGLAAIRALILAKFMLVAHELKLGERYRNGPLIYMIVYKSIIFLVVLVVLLYVEEVAVGAIHGRTIAQSLSEIADGKWMEVAAICFLGWLMLLPYFGVRQISDALGEGQLRQMLFGNRWERVPADVEGDAGTK